MRTICLDCFAKEGRMELKSNVDPLFFLSLRDGGVVCLDEGMEGVKEQVWNYMEQNFQHDVWERFESMVEAGQVVGVFIWSIKVEINVVVLLE